MVRAKERLDEELTIQQQHPTKPPDQQQTWALSSHPSTVIITQTHNKTSSFCTLKCQSFLYSSVWVEEYFLDVTWKVIYPEVLLDFIQELMELSNMFLLFKSLVLVRFLKEVSSRLHLLDRNYSKKRNIVKYCYNLNYLFSSWIYWKM